MLCSALVLVAAAAAGGLAFVGWGVAGAVAVAYPLAVCFFASLARDLSKRRPSLAWFAVVTLPCNALAGGVLACVHALLMEGIRGRLGLSCCETHSVEMTLVSAFATLLWWRLAGAAVAQEGSAAQPEHAAVEASDEPEAWERQIQERARREAEQRERARKAKSKQRKLEKRDKMKEKKRQEQEAEEAEQLKKFAHW